jgi:glycosyltransferase involved in cell wall biosynthesis
VRQGLAEEPPRSPCGLFAALTVYFNASHIMKIGLVTSYMPPHLGGIERIAENLFVGYHDSGAEVRWVASRVQDQASRREDRRVAVPCFNLVEDLLGVPVPIWGLTGWVEVRRLAQWADAIHTLDCLYLSSAMAVILAKRHGKPVVISQNVGFIPYRSPLLNGIERVAYATFGRLLLRHASHVVLATPTATGHVNTLFPQGLAHTSAFPIGIDTTLFHPPSEEERSAARKSFGLSAEANVVLFVGRLVEKKGLAIALEVCRQLPRVRLVVAGDGPLRTLLSPAPANLTWHHAVAPDRMPEYYHAADAVLLPSHGEGLPLVVQEAMACGLPVIIAEDEPYAQGLLAAQVCVGAARQPEAMTKQVSEVLAGANPLLGRRARAYAQEHWSLRAMIVRYLALFESILSSGRCTP